MTTEVRIDLDIRRGATDNKVGIALTQTFTNGRLLVFAESGAKRVLTVPVGDATLTLASGKLTWSPTAAQTKLLSQSYKGLSNNTWRLEGTINGIVQPIVSGLINGIGSDAAVLDAPASGSSSGGTGGSTGGGSAHALRYPWVYRKNKQINIPAGATVAAVTALGANNSMMLIPWVPDRDITVQKLFSVCGATAAGGLAQCAIYNGLTPLGDAGATSKDDLYTGTPIATSNEANCNTIGFNVTFILNSTITLRKGKVYWIAVKPSANGVGFLGCLDTTYSDEIGGFGAGNLFSYTSPNDFELSAMTYAGGPAYASSYAWPDLTAVGLQSQAVGPVPIFGFQTGATAPT